MSWADHGSDLLVATAEEYAPRRVGEGLTHLEGLNLFVQIRQQQAMAAAGVALFISEVDTITQQRRKGMTVTCVGQGQDLPSAVNDSVAQWALGVLPVLAQWRGRHSCLPASQTVQTREGSFELLSGPTMTRGHSDEVLPPSGEGANPIGSLLPLLQAARPAARLHWLELFNCKTNGGQVDATCRLNNHDWLSATKVLSDMAAGWPVSSEPMQSQRQFALFRPTGDPAQDIVLPTFWARMTGRA